MNVDSYYEGQRYKAATGYALHIFTRILFVHFLVITVVCNVFMHPRHAHKTPTVFSSLK